MRFVRDDEPAWTVQRPLPDGTWAALGYWSHDDAGEQAACAYAARCAGHGFEVRVRVDPPRGTP